MNDEDGKIIIGTEIDSKQLETDLKKLTKKFDELNEKEEELQKRKLKLEIELKGDYKKEIDELADMYNWVMKDTTENTPQKTIDWINSQYQPKLDAINRKYARQISAYNTINEKLKENTIKQEEIKNNINEINSTLESRKGINAFLNGTKEINKGITTAIKKVGRWAIALFGIRSAYSFIRQMTSQAIQQNEELANKMQYIKSALGSAFQPVAKVVVDIIYKLLAGIGAIIKLITGKNIFENVNTDLKNANKNAKALQKTLAGWDEATVLGSNSNLANGLLGNGLNIADDVEKVSKKINEWFTKPLTKEDIMKVVNSYIGAFNLGYNWLKENIFNPGIGYIKQMIQETEPLWGPVWYKMQEAFIPAIQKMKQEWSKFKDFLQPAKDFFDKLFEPAKIAWNDMVENYLKPAWQSFYNSLPQPVQDALNKIWIKFKELYNDIAFYLNNIGIHVAYITDTTETEVGKTTKKVKQNVGEINSQVNKLSGAKINITTNTSSINKLKDILDEIVYNVQILTGKNVITTTTWTTKANPKSAKGSIIYPKLAVGGIVNMPGRGVPYHGATIAERGAEAVVPLTDSQQMALLGEAIGKYITINATIPVYAYNRQVDRQIQKIQNQQDFAMNR